MNPTILVSDIMTGIIFVLGIFHKSLPASMQTDVTTLVGGLVGVGFTLVSIYSHYKNSPGNSGGNGAPAASSSSPPPSLPSMFLLCVLGVLGGSLLSGCSSSSTPQQTIVTVGNISVGLAWGGYAAAYDAATIAAEQGRLSPATAAKLTKDFAAAYDSITALQTMTMAASTSQPSIDTLNQEALIVAEAILTVQGDLHGVPATGGGAPITLNLPVPPIGGSN